MPANVNVEQRSLDSIIAATNNETAIAAAQTVVAQVVTQHEDDVIQSMKDLLKPGSKLRSRKLWFGLALTLLPIIAQVITGALTWPVAGPMATVAGVGYLFSQAGVDKTQAQALGDFAGAVVAAKKK